MHIKSGKVNTYQKSAVNAVPQLQYGKIYRVCLKLNVLTMHTHTHTQETKILYQNGKAKFVTDAWRSSCLNGKLSEGEMSPSILKKSFFSTSDLRKHLRSATMLQIRSLTIILLIGMTFESPLDSQSVNQSILKEINLEQSLEALMLKLKLQYFGDLMQRADSLEKTLMLERLRAGGVKGDRG